MRIAVVGKGTSSIIQILHLFEIPCEIDVYYDPNIPILNVGESSTPSFLDLIFLRTGITAGMLHDDGIASYKMGVKFVNWSKGKTFRHYFNPSAHAVQFETTILNSYFEKIFKSLGVNYIPERVENHILKDNCVSVNGRSYDFAIFCTGWHEEDNSRDVPFETVNSAVLYKKDWVDEEEPFFTFHTATPHGWEFGLPFPKRGLTKFGYLFNNKVDDEQAILNLISSDPNKKEVRTVSWRPKYAEKVITSPFTALGGNRLFFSEPLQAFSLLYYNIFGSMIVDYLKQRTETLRAKINIQYNSFITQYMAAVAFHYQFGSIYKTPFWETTKLKAMDVFKLNSRYNVEIVREGFEAEYRAFAEKLNFIPLGEEEDESRRHDKLIKLGPLEWVDFRDLYKGFVDDRPFKYEIGNP